LPPNTRKRIFVTEEQLILAVKQLLGKQLYAEQGKQLNIVYLGKRERSNGPDFQGTLILNSSGQLIKGDIEVHIYASDWYRHGHQHNSEYNNVILHIVAQQQLGNVTRTKSGRLIPIICLPRELYIQPYLMQYYHLLCYQVSNRKDNHFLYSLLNMAGEQRFRQKASLFQAQMRLEKPSHVLFRGMLRALGYSQNMRPFEELARRLSLDFLEQLEPHENVCPKQAWLLGTAGLLPSQRKTTVLPIESKMEILETIWQKTGNNRVSMSEDDWQLSHIYPHNSPINRILALGHIIQRYHKIGFLKGLLQLVYEAVPVPGHPSIEEGLMVTLDRQLQKQQGITTPVHVQESAQLGISKASQIAVNTILPFAFAWGKIVCNTVMIKRALNLYLRHQKMADNTITRHMRSQLGLGDSHVFNACQQQGLIHLYKDYCMGGKCSECLFVN
jgi:hypothetical protein